MEALQRMMTRRLDEHSYKRTAKRLVVDEYTNDLDFNDKTEIASMNPAYDIFYGETIRTKTNPNSPIIDASFSTTTCSTTTSLSSLYHIEPTPIITATTINDDHSRTDKLLRKVSLVVRRKLTGPKPFINGQQSACIIDLVDAYAIGRKHHSEHRKLLNEEYGDD
ncbi:tRNA uridine 5-carboxymethylaminomethyl modification enzyme MnmG [Dirofilaria immitis]